MRWEWRDEMRWEWRDEMRDKMRDEMRDRMGDEMGDWMGDMMGWKDADWEHDMIWYDMKHENLARLFFFLLQRSRGGGANYGVKMVQSNSNFTSARGAK